MNLNYFTKDVDDDDAEENSYSLQHEKAIQIIHKIQLSKVSFFFVD